MLLRIDDTGKAREVRARSRRSLGDLDWLGIVLERGARAPEQPCRTASRGGRALERGGRATLPVRRRLPPRERRRRSRLRDHARRPRRRSPLEHRTAAEARPTPSASSRRSTSTTAAGRRRRQEAKGDDRGAAGRRHPGRGGARLPRGARRAHARRAPRRAADPPAGDRRDRGAHRRGARRACRRAAPVRPRTARGARPRRGACDGEGDPRAAARLASGRGRADAAALRRAPRSRC